MTNSYFLKDLLDLNTKGGESNRYVLAKKVKTYEEITFTCLDVTSNMSNKSIGYALLGIGVIVLVWAVFIFDTTVAAEVLGANMRVNNLGLLNDQSNYSMLGGVIAVIGVLLIFKGDNDKSQINNSSPTTVNPTNLYLSEFTGDKSLANDAYKIYLSKKYTIEKDAALDKFVCNDRLFNNVDDALTYANSLEQSLTDSFKSTTSNKVSEASSQVSENHNSSQSILSDQANKAESSQEKNSDNKLISDNKLMIIISAVLIFGLGTFFFYKSNTSSNSAQSNTSPLSPTEMATRVDSLADQGKTEEAIEHGRTFLKTNKDPQGAVEKSLKRAYIAAAQTPSPDSASSDKASSPDWMKKESTSSLSPNLTPSKTEPQSTESVSVDGASVITGPNGTVVRAGDAVVIMPK